MFKYFRNSENTLHGNIVSSERNSECVSLVFATNLVNARSVSRFWEADFSLMASYSVTGCLCVCLKKKNENSI